jgi:hypothetical protein
MAKRLGKVLNISYNIRAADQRGEKRIIGRRVNN